MRPNDAGKPSEGPTSPHGIHHHGGVLGTGQCDWREVGVEVRLGWSGEVGGEERGGGTAGISKKLGGGEEGRGGEAEVRDQGTAVS